MDPLVSTLILIALALVGARLSFSSSGKVSGPSLLLQTGAQFLFVGFLLGPEVLGLFPTAAVEDLFPLLALALGWIGFLFGLQLDRSSLGHFPKRYHLAMILQAVLTYLIFAGGAWLIFSWTGILSDETRPLMWVAAATAAISTPAALSMVSSNFLLRGRVRRLLLFHSSLDAVVGIIAVQWIYGALHPNPGFLPMPAVVWLAAATGLGLLCALIFLRVSQPRAGKEELVLFLLGVSAFASGAALKLQLSPLFVSVVMGAIVANLAPDKDRIFQALQNWEKEIYVVLLLLAGALIRLETIWVLPLGIGYFLIRGIAKTVANGVAPKLSGLRDLSPKIGMGLVAQGGISLAMALSAVLIFADLDLVDETAGSTFLAVIVIGVILSELVGPFLAIRLFRAVGEISPKVEAALADGDQERARKEALIHHRADIED